MDELKSDIVHALQGVGLSTEKLVEICNICDKHASRATESKACSMCGKPATVHMCDEHFRHQCEMAHNAGAAGAKVTPSRTDLDPYSQFKKEAQ